MKQFITTQTYKIKTRLNMHSSETHLFTKESANHGWANLLSLLKLYPTLQRVDSKSCVIYSKDQLQLTGTIFWYDGCEGP